MRKGIVIILSALAGVMNASAVPLSGSISLETNLLTYTTYENVASNRTLVISNSGANAFTFTTSLTYDESGESGWASVFPTGSTLVEGAALTLTNTATVASGHPSAPGTYYATCTVASVSAINSPQKYTLKLIAYNGCDVFPSSGPLAGGNVVTITNTYQSIGDGSDITNVVVGTVGATNIVGQGTNWVSFVAPATGSAGMKDIVIQTSDNGDIPLAGAYTVNPAGSIGGTEYFNVWTNLGSGVAGSLSRVYSLAHDGANLYAGGDFTSAGGTSATNIAKWNGTAWTNLADGLGISSRPVMVLKTVGTNLYAGGDFTNAGGLAGGKYIAKWNGTAWESLGSGMSASMNALAHDGANLYAGGSFTNAGGVNASRVAKWNGTTWTNLGSGVSGGANMVWALAHDGTNLYAAGSFTTAGEVPATNIAKWNGGEVPATNIAKWNGSVWTNLGNGLDSTATALAWDGSNLYAGGQFTSASGNTNAKYVAMWNGTTWTNLGSGMSALVNALAHDGTNLYAGGTFSTAGGVAANRVAMWNGTTWTNLGSGWSATVRVLAHDGTNLYAGGNIGTVGGVPAVAIAKWGPTAITSPAISPSSGVWTGGYPVVISGTNLGNGVDITNVTLCGASATIASQTAERVWIVAGQAVNAGLGDVRVFSTSYGETVKSNAFTYTGPGLQVLGTNGAVIAGGEGAAATKGADFGHRLVGSSTVHTFSLTNNGTDALTIDGWSTNGDVSSFTISDLPSVISVSSVVQFNVTFTPSAPGSFSASLAISNDSPTASYILNLAGSAFTVSTNVGPYAGGNTITIVNGVSARNGVFGYGASSVFPTQSFNAANYWVDVVFQAGTSPTLTSIWPSGATPGLVDGGPDDAVELGVKFRSDVAGTITGIRFYKGSANTGTHVGNLWSSAGTWLATAIFTNETESGWQEALFATPVAIVSNTVYVASYHADNGHYSADLNYFLTGVDNPPLHALTDGAGGSDITNVIVGGVKATITGQGADWVTITIPATTNAGVKDIRIESASLGVTLLQDTYTYHPAGRIGSQSLDWSRWSEVAGLPMDLSQGSAVILNGAIHHLGGSSTSSGVRTNVYAFDGANWTETAGLPLPVYGSSAGALGDKLYVIGGRVTNGLPYFRTNVFAFNGSAWTEVAGLPSNRWKLASAALGNALYAIGGSAGEPVTMGAAGVFRFDGTNWTSVAPLPAPRSRLAAAALQGNIYAIGGYDLAANITNTVYKYDGTNWTMAAALPAARSDLAAVTLGDYLYAYGGISISGARTNAYRFDGTNWTEVVGLPRMLSSLAGAEGGGRIYSLGGFSGGSVTNVFVYPSSLSVDVEPAAGSYTGGYPVVIAGVNLGNGADITNVTVCGVAALLGDQTATSVVVTVGRASVLGVGDVRVYSVSYGETVKSNVFTYLAPVLKVRCTNGAVIGSDTGVSPVNGTDFGNVWSQTMATNRFSITNSGNMALTIGSFTTNGAGAAQFTVSGVPSVVSVGGVSNFTVRFDASVVGAHTCAVVFVSDATNDTYVLNLAAASVKSNQTITFPAIAPQKRNGSVGLAATADSGLPVSFEVSSGPGSLAGSINLTFSDVGTVVVMASQTGNLQYVAAPTVTNVIHVYNTSTNVGPYAGGNTITITNGHFGTITNVLVGGVSATLVNSGANWATITLPAATNAGVKDIVVQTSDNGDITLMGAYTVNPVGGIYDNRTEGWTAINSLPSARMQMGAAYYNGAIYAIGGAVNNSPFTPQTNVFRFNGTNWTEVAGLPMGMARLSAGVLNGYLYALGGGDGSSSVTNVFRYDGTNWTEAAGLPSGRQRFGVATYSNALYAIGGNTSAQNVYRFNGATWTEVAGLPSDTGPSMAGVLGNKLYAYGWFYPNVYEFNGTSWTEVAGMPGASGNFAGGGVYEGALYSVGGFVSSDHSTVYRFNGATWASASNLPFARSGMGVAGTEDGLYAFGGSINFGSYADALRYRLGSVGVTPASGSYTGGYQVVIIGTNLCNGSASDVTNVTVCGVKAVSVDHVYGATQLVVTVGAGAPGVGHVVVYSADYGVTVKSNIFTYLAPVLKVRGTNGAVIANGASVSPVNGTDFGNVWSQTMATNRFSITNSGNTMLTLSGYTTNGAGAAQFALSGVPASVSAGGVSNFTVRFDASVLGAHTCAVTFVSDATNSTYVLNLAGASVKSNQTITFSAIAPQRLNGSVGLAATVNSGLPVSFAVSSGPGNLIDTNLTFTDVGTVYVTASQTGNLQYAAAPTVTNLIHVYNTSTNIGPYAGGNTMTLTNGNLGTITNVLVGGVSATLVNSGANWATITLPAVGSAGVKDIVIQTSDHGAVTLANAYTVNPAGGIANVRPVGGSYTGGYSVVIAGTNLCAGDVTNVTLCGVKATLVSQMATQVVATAGATTSFGVGAVRVYSVSYGETVKTNAFTYRMPQFRLLGTNGAVIAGGNTTSLADGTDYGSIMVGRGALTNTFVATNGGNTGLVISGVTTSGAGAASFQLVAPLPVSYPVTNPAGNEAYFQVAFQPQGGGSQNVAFTIYHNGTNSPFVLNLTGFGLGGGISLKTNALSYTATYQGTNPAAQTISMTNVGVSGFTYTNVIAYSAEASGWLTSLPDNGMVALGGATRLTNGVNIGGLNAGTYFATNAVTAADATNSPQTLVAQLTVEKADQTITFPAIPDQHLTNHAYGLAAAAGSGLPVSFSVLSGPVSLTDGTNLIFTGVGDVSVVASQGGDTNWNAAANVTNTFEVYAVIWVSQPITNGVYNAAYRYDLYAYERQSGRSIAYSGANLPAWLSVTNLDLITTVAGTGTNGYSGDGAPATNATLNFAIHVAVGPDNTWAIADTVNNRIRKVDANGAIATVAGNGSFGYSGDGAAATNAMLGLPEGVAMDEAGNVYIADTENQRIRKIDTNGVIVTIAGAGTAGDTGDGGAATNAQLNFPKAVAVDPVGNVYVADSENNRIRKVATDGVITTVAGNGTYAYGGDGGPATNASLQAPSGVAVDSEGNVFIADRYNNRIRKVDAAGIVTTVAGNGNLGYSGDGGVATNATLNYPYAVAVDWVGRIYISDTENTRIRRVDTNGTIDALAGNGNFGYSGDGGPALDARLDSPNGVAVDSVGRVYVADYYNMRIRQISPTAGILSGTPTAAGAYDIALWASDGNSSNAQNFRLVIDKASATVTLTNLTQTYDGTARAASATTDPAGLTVVFTYDGATNAPVNAGSYAVTGTVADVLYQGFATGTLGIAQADQTIDFPTIDDQLATNRIGLSATASSALAVTFATNGGPALIADGTNLSFSGTGLVSIVASQSGDGNWNVAPDVTNTFNVTKALASVTLTNLTQTYDGTARAVLATTVPAGLAVLLTYDGNAWAPTNVGTYAVTGVVDDVFYEGSAMGTLVVTQGVATVTLTNLTQTYDGTARAVLATTVPSGLTVLFTYDGDTNAPTDAGSYAVTGTVSDVNWRGEAVGTLTIAKADQSIAFGAINDQETTNRVGLAASASSGLTVTFATNGGSATIADGTNLSFSGAGLVSIVASQAGDTNWNAAPDVTNTFNVTKALASVTLTNLTQTYDGTARAASATTDPAGLTVVFTYDGATNAPVNAGSYAVTGTVEDVLYQGMQTGTLTVAKAGQVISFGVISDQLATNRIGLSATASSALAVTFATNGGPAAIADGTNLSFSGTGLVSIVASQSGDGNWTAAPDVTNTFNVTKALASVTLTNLTQTYDGTPRMVSAISVPSGLSVLFTYDGVTWAPTNVGTYTVTGVVDDVFYEGSAMGTLVVTQGVATVTLTNLTQTYDGTPRAVSATSVPAGLSVLFTYDGDTNAPTDVGSYAVTGTVNDVNWQGEAVGTLTIEPAAASVYLSNLTQTYDGLTHSVTATTDPSGLTVDLTYDGSSSAPVNAGSYAVTGKINEVNYTGITVDMLSVSKATQTVAFTSPVSPVAQTGVWTVAATASSSLPVTNFSVSSGPGVVVGAQLTFTNAGYVTLSAAQEGDGNWLSASATTDLYVAGVPLWVSTPVTTGTCLQPYLYTLDATDLDSPAVFYSAEPLPDWLNLTTFTNHRIIRTLAGQGTAGYNGDDQPALDAQLKFPAGLFRDASGLYIADQYNHRVRHIDPFGIVETIAGDGTAGTGGDGGAATNAQLLYPTAVTRDAAGNLYIADRDNNRVRKVDTNGLITTFAGTGVAGNTGDGGAATNARLRFPSGVAVDSSGNVYIADRDNNRIRKVNTDGLIATFAGNGIAGYLGDGGAATNARLRNPVGLALDNTGKLYIADQNNHAIRRIKGGVIATVAGVGTGGFNGDEIAATNATLNKPAGVAIGADGNLYIADTDNHRIRWVDDTGIIHSLAGMTNSGFSGDGGPATNAQLYTPFAVMVDDSGVVALSDYNNQRIRQIGLPTVGLTGTPPTGGVYNVALWASDGVHSNAQNFQLVIDKAPATVALTNLTQTYDGTPRVVSATSVPSGLSVLFTYNGDTNAPTDVGTYAVTGTVNDATYQGSTVGALTVTKAGQAISFGVIGDQLTTNKVGLAASADSGLAVSFATNGGPAAIADGTNLSFTGAGEVRIVASQSGDGNWNAAADVTNTFNVTKAVAGLTLNDLSQTYDGTPRVVSATSVPSGLSVLFTYNGDTNAPTDVGTYAVTGTVNEVMYRGAATGALEVTKGTAGVYLGGLTQVYDGSARSVTATTMPSGLTVEFTYDGNVWAPTNAGSYAVTGTVNDANWQGQAIGSLEVDKGAAEVYLGDLTQVYDGSARSVTATTMPSGLTVEFTYDGNAWVPTNAGIYTVTGAVDDVNYQGVQTGALVVAKAEQTITNFPSIGDQIVTNVVHLSAQASSGLPVIFAGFGQQSISGTNLTFTGTGEVTIVAAQWGNENWNAAPVTSQAFVVRAVTYTITPAAGANGSILPGTPVTLDAGQSASFVVGAASDYYIASLTTNGAEVRGVAGLYAYTSWWNNVQADGALVAAFASVTNDTATNGTSVPWLRQYYTNEADLEALKERANLDTDVDGMLAWEEYWSRTDPTDSNKFLHLIPVQGASGSTGSVIQWTSETGVVYRLTSSTNLLTDPFTTVVYTNISANPPINAVTDETAIGKARLYYRIGVEK